MTTMKGISSNVLWLLIDKIVVMLTNVIVIFVVANYYGADEYGLFQFILNIIMVLEVVVSLVDGRVVKKYYTTNKNEEHIVYTVLGLKMLLCIAEGALGVAFLIIYSHDLRFKIIFVVLLVDSMIKSLRFCMQNRFEYHLKSKNVVLAVDFGLILSVIMQIFAVNNHMKIIVIPNIQIITDSIAILVLIFLYKKTFGKSQKQKFDIQLAKKILSESFPLALATAASVIYTRSDLIMLGMLMSTKEVGIYNIAVKLVSVVQIFIVPVQTTIYVHMIECFNDKNKYNKLYTGLSSFMTWLAICGIGLLVVLLPYILSFINDEFHPSLSIFYILSVGIVFNYNAILRSSHITLINKGYILLLVQCVADIFNIIMNFALIKRFGMYGAAFSTVTSQFLSLFLSNIVFRETHFILIKQISAFNPINAYKYCKDLVIHES